MNRQYSNRKEEWIHYRKETSLVAQKQKKINVFTVYPGNSKQMATKYTSTNTFMGFQCISLQSTQLSDPIWNLA